jgi:hypothetical protein
MVCRHTESVAASHPPQVLDHGQFEGYVPPCAGTIPWDPRHSIPLEMARTAWTAAEDLVASEPGLGYTNRAAMYGVSR